MNRNPRSFRDFRVLAGSAALVLLASGCAEKQEPAGTDVLVRNDATSSSPAVRQGATSPPPQPQPNEIDDAVRQKLAQLGYSRGEEAEKKAEAGEESLKTKAAKPAGEIVGGFQQPAGRSFELYKNIIDDKIRASRGSADAASPPPSAAMAEAVPVPVSPPASVRIAPTPAPENTERYQRFEENPLHVAATDPVSTFSLDVDTGSYANVRRFLEQGSRPPEDAVRVEELVNYFPYEYPHSTGSDPFGIRTELAPCPWQNDHWLMRVAVRADEVDAKEMPPVNLVFLVDVSGSMDDPAKLPLLRSSLKLLAQQLRAEDRVGLVVYAGREAVVLESTPGDQHAKIESAIDSLTAGGSTAGEAGIRAAYRLARGSLVKGGINRVLLATDGDFNVGTSSTEELKKLVEKERESGVQLSTLGFGTGNYNESMMEQIADVGNGSYAYIDTLQEGRKVLVDQMRSTMVTVAKDVKVQVEFNPAVVAEYRLIGYENRVLATEDFNNDRVDAGDVGAGQSVTALYELTPVGAPTAVDPLRYGAAAPNPEASANASNEVAFVKIRDKEPNATTSKLVRMPVEKSALLASFDNAGDDFRFATAVAGFGQLLRGGKRTGAWGWDDVLSTATNSRGRDEFGYRSEFLNLVRMAKITS